jgi:hypothetical protein
MTATNLLSRAPASVKKYGPLALALLVLVVGYLWFVGPRLAATFQAGRDVGSLERRAAGLRAALSSAGSKGGESRRGVAEFERLVSRDDRLPEVMEIVARLALDPPDADRARGLVLNSGESARGEGVSSAVPGQPPVADDLDPRWALFPGSVGSTPITVAFETTYERLGQFLWRLRDLPTLVEIRSLDVSRALPLAKVKMTLLVLRRTERPPAPASGTAARPGPRVALAQVPGFELSVRSLRTDGTERLDGHAARVLPWR